MVTDFMIELQEQGYSANYVKEVKKGVSAFFKANAEDVVYISRGLKDESSNGKERATKEHLRALIDATGSVRNKSLITVGKDTGLRVSDLSNIRVKHVKDAIEKDLEFHTFEIEIVKTTSRGGIRGNPCIGPDAMKYLKKWWVERERYGCTEGPEDFLYCKVEDKPEHVRGGKVIPGQRKGDPITAQTITQMLSRLIKKAGITENISAHSMRKFNETKLGAEIPSGWIDKMTGRAEGYKGPYEKPDSEELLTRYKKAYPSLQLAASAATLEDVARLRGEVAELKGALESIHLSRGMNTATILEDWRRDEEARR